MTAHRYVVTVKAETKAQADQVMSERLFHDEWYGFDYSVDFETEKTGGTNESEER